MTHDPSATRTADAPSPAASFAVMGTDFVDVLALFVRTIPLYPDGHGRVVAVSERLVATAAAQTNAVVIEVADRGLIVDGAARPELSPGTKALREALIATAVARVTFEPGTPSTSFVAFARTLHRNARSVGSGSHAFSDLWAERIPGVEVAELVFHHGGFGGDGSTRTHGESTALGFHAGVAVGAAASAELDAVADALGEVRTDSSGPATAGPRLQSVSKDLRELAHEDPILSESVGQLEVLLMGDGAVRSSQGLDVLEHLLRALPLEARIDPSRGVVALRKIVERLLARLENASQVGSPPDLPTRLFQSLQSVFPGRGPEHVPTDAGAGAPAASPSPAPAADVAADLGVIDAWQLEQIAPGGAPPPVPALVPDDGLVDPAGLLLHAFLEEPAGERRDDLRRRLIAAYGVRPRAAPPPCILAHLAEAIAVPAPSRDLARVADLAGIVEEAGIELRGAVTLPLDVVVSIFPVCLGPWLRAGGSAGALARRVGRDAVLGAAARLCSPGGALTGPALDRVLAERTADATPFLEAFLVSDAANRSRVVRALRALDIRSLAAVALRVVPESRFTDRFLAGMCADAFEGVESRHWIAEAAAVLGTVAVDAEGVLDTTTRAYATAALGTFPPSLARSPLTIVAARKLFGSAPRELRRAAQEILDRFAREEAEARAVP